MNRRMMSECRLVGVTVSFHFGIYKILMIDTDLNTIRVPDQKPQIEWIP